MKNGRLVGWLVVGQIGPSDKRCGGGDSDSQRCVEGGVDGRVGRELAGPGLEDLEEVSASLDLLDSKGLGRG